MWFDEHGQHAVASYGETKAECSAVKPTCNAILEEMADAHDDWKERALVAEQRLASVTTLVSIYENQDEPEGQVSARRALTAIGETIGQQCSICRSRHGSEVRHHAE